MSNDDWDAEELKVYSTTNWPGACVQIVLVLCVTGLLALLMVCLLGMP